MIEQLTRNGDSLQKLIDYCSSNSASAPSYNELRNTLIRYFQLKADIDPETAADQTLDRVGVKIQQQTEILDLKKYSIGVARFIFLERIKVHAREKEAAAEYYSGQESKPVEYEEDTRLRKWRECFQSLNSDERILLKNYFADLPFSPLNEKRIRLCSEYQISMNNLRLKVFRLRQRLEKCVQKNLD